MSAAQPEEAPRLQARADKAGLMRSLGGLLSEATGMVFALACAILVLGLSTGGLAYQKTCITSDWRVDRSWSFQWFAPIPYVFRPSGDGCVVHTGTRVALNAIGVFSYPDETVNTLADKAADGITNKNVAYWSRVSGTIASFDRAMGNAGNITAGERAVREAATGLEKMAPPAAFAVDHRAATDALWEYLRALKDAERKGAFNGALRARLRKAQRTYNRAIREMNVTWSIIKRNP